MSLKQKVKEFFKPSPREYAKIILGNSPFVTIDVGAANGLVPHWHTLDGFATVVSFEPHEQSYRELLGKYAKSDYRDLYKPFPFGLSEFGGETTLYMLNERTGSSILPVDMNSPWLKKDDPYVFPITEVKIQTKNLKQVFEEEKLEAPSMIKLDIQGAELSVLRGLGEDRLNTLMSVEMEVGFQSFHLGAPNPFEVIEAMKEYGLEFYDLSTNRHFTGKGTDGDYYLRRLGVSNVYNKVSNRLTESDLLFFRSPDAVVRNYDPAASRKLIVTYCVYNYFTDACSLNDRCLEEGIWQKDVHASIERAIRNWSNIYNWRYGRRRQWAHAKYKWLLSHLQHKPWQTPPKDL